MSVSDPVSVDVVVPVLNEAKELPLFFADLAGQVDADGEQLSAGTVCAIVVDSESTDGTPAIVEESRARHPGLQIVFVQEPVRNHVAARARGAAVALERPGALLASADVDTRFHPQWIQDIGRRLGVEGLDAVTYSGHYPASFWKAVPRLARRYFDEVGTIFFGPETVAHYGFDPAAALFTPGLFRDLVRMPSDCAWAYTKAVYERAGGFRRERYDDGREVVFEGRNLRFRLDALGARVAYVDTAPFETSPRRLLAEAGTFLEGSAYGDELRPIREAGGAEQHAALERLADTYDFAALRRYVVKHYVLLPVVSRPALLTGNERYFGTAAAAVRETLDRFAAAPRSAASIHLQADALLAAHFGEIVASFASAR